jgi:hypothetical protein
MYRDHNPPHFHNSTTSGEAQVSLVSLSIIRGEITSRDFTVALDWARENLDLLWAEWNRLNG